MAILLLSCYLLCWSSQASTWNTSHMKNCHQSNWTTLHHFVSCLLSWLPSSQQQGGTRESISETGVPLYMQENRRHAVERSSQSCMGSCMTILLLRFSSGADAGILCCGTPHLQPDMPSIIQILTNQALEALQTRYFE